MGKRPFYVIEKYYELEDGSDRGSKVLCLLHKKEDAISRFKYLFELWKDDFTDEGGVLCDNSFNIRDEADLPFNGVFYFNEENTGDYVNCRLVEIFTDSFDNGAELAYKNYLELIALVNRI